MSSCLAIFNKAVQDISICGPAPYGGLLSTIASTGVLALFVIAGIGMMGQISPSVMSWSLTGLSGGLAALAILGTLNVLKDKTVEKEKKQEAIIKVIMPLILTILSTLSGYGVISSMTLGWCVFGPLISVIAIGVLLVPIAICRKNNINQQTSAPTHL